MLVTLAQVQQKDMTSRVSLSFCQIDSLSTKVIRLTHTSRSTIGAAEVDEFLECLNGYSAEKLGVVETRNPIVHWQNTQFERLLENEKIVAWTVMGIGNSPIALTEFEKQLKFSSKPLEVFDDVNLAVGWLECIINLGNDK